ncbi:hypothetical protein M9H77_35515 [Catharanthus roseus]|uniref:Uncharacterized protein n=1 Tax=Catharanthus roseus TaxID=4058 RepID=A0ACB9ZSW7_CATRO|nr:hypothetical protein M9H77_35515 [Catharanthus roseus]
MDLWNEKALAKICSKIGKTLSTDAMIEKKKRVPYVWALIEVDIAKELVKEIYIQMTNGNTGEKEGANNVGCSKESGHTEVEQGRKKKDGEGHASVSGLKGRVGNYLAMGNDQKEFEMGTAQKGSKKTTEKDKGKLPMVKNEENGLEKRKVEKILEGFEQETLWAYFNQGGGDEIGAQAEHKARFLVDAERRFYAKKTKCEFLLEGDRNSKEIQEELTRFNRDLLGTKNEVQGFDATIMNKGRPEFTMHEIKVVFFDISNEKSPGLDGYTSYFSKMHGIL